MTTNREIYMVLGEIKMGFYVDIEKELSGFNLKIKFSSEKNIVGLLGASGSGKSMTLKFIAGLDTPDRGKIILNKKVLYDSDKKINIPSRKRKVGFLFQNYALFPNMTVEQNIGFGLQNIEKSKRNGIISEKINMMNLKGLEKRFPNQLSGGQQQRVAIARALAIEPEILLLDEPFSALDTHLRSKMEEQLMNILSNYNGYTIYVSHNRDEIYRICKNIAVINKGKVEAFGDRDYIFKNPPTFSAAQLTGCKNISKVEVIDEHTIKAVDWGFTLKINDRIQDKVSYVGIRAHYIELADDTKNENTFKCCVNHINESPFTVSVYLDNVEEKTHSNKSLLWEIPKEKWTVLKEIHQPFNIYIDKNNFFLIK